MENREQKERVARYLEDGFGMSFDFISDGCAEQCPDAFSQEKTMPFKKFYAIGAVGFCISVLPFMTHAQSAEASVAEDAIFVPMVGECVDTPNADTCGRVRAVVTECAVDLERALCDILFVEADAVFDIPEMEERAQLLLSETSDAIAEMEFEDVNEAEIDGIVEESRADAERTMLRGDENPMSHSGPPSVEED